MAEEIDPFGEVPEGREELAGDATIADCAVAPGDVLGVRRVGVVGDPDNAWVAFAAADATRGAVVQIVLTPQDARAVAAATLDAADECDGTTPLSFFPNCPDAGYPPGHPSA